MQSHTTPPMAGALAHRVVRNDKTLSLTRQRPLPAQSESDLNVAIDYRGVVLQASVLRPLAIYLEGIFGKPGLILHGETSVKHRKALVDSFQSDDGPPLWSF